MRLRYLKPKLRREPSNISTGFSVVGFGASVRRTSQTLECHSPHTPSVGVALASYKDCGLLLTPHRLRYSLSWLFQMQSCRMPDQVAPLQPLSISALTYGQ